MKKIPNVFVRDWNGDSSRVLREVEPVSAWVAAGEGVPTRKYDGTACLWKDGQLWRRYDAKRGKTPPHGFVPAQEPDAVTGHHPGWLPVDGSPECKWHREALDLPNLPVALMEGMTYELCGPKVQGNPEGFDAHRLVRHGAHVVALVPPYDYDSIEAFLRSNPMEGIVWHHPDGRMAKVKRRDFGIDWPVKA